MIRLEGELTSVKISQDSQYALINRASENGPPAVRRSISFLYPFLFPSNVRGVGRGE